MTAFSRLTRWAAALALGLAGLVGVSAATVDAAPTSVAPNVFELTLEGKLALTPVGVTSQGTFRSGAPFCATGTFVDEFRSGGTKRRFLTCDDSSGSLTASIAGSEYPSGETSTWRIVDGNGSYAGLRGGGSQHSEVLSEGDDWFEWRSTLQGVVAWDGVAPTIDISSAKARKLHRPAGAYSIELALALRDNIEENPVSYKVGVRVSRRGGEVARKLGTATGIVLVRLRIRPPAGARSVQLKVTGVDPIGNAVSRRHAVKLPR